jgi:hypothetical protein
MDETLWLVLECWPEGFWAVSARLISGSVVGWTTTAVQRDGRSMNREVAADGGHSGPRRPFREAGTYRWNAERSSRLTGERGVRGRP